MLKRTAGYWGRSLYSFFALFSWIFPPTHDHEFQQSARPSNDDRQLIESAWQLGDYTSPAEIVNQRNQFLGASYGLNQYPLQLFI